MQSEGALVLFAELSVAFAGFTGVVGALRRGKPDDDAARQASELRLLIEYSILTLIKSVLPLVLWNIGLPELDAWRVACAYAVIESATYYWFRFSALRANAPPESSKSFRAGFVIDSVVVFGLFLGAVNVFPWGPSAIYLVALLWNLIGTALSFIRLVQPIWKANGGPAA